jgi:hypothetical protein
MSAGQSNAAVAAAEESNPKEIDEIFKRLQSQRGVVGVMCFTSEGSTVR